MTATGPFMQAYEEWLKDPSSYLYITAGAGDRTLAQAEALGYHMGEMEKAIAATLKKLPEHGAGLRIEETTTIILEKPPLASESARIETLRTLLARFGGTIEVTIDPEKHKMLCNSSQQR